jgi:hypothetical protein
VGARFSASVPIICGVHLAFYTMGTGSFLEVKFSAEIKEIVELYLYFPSLLSWQIIG